MAKTATSKAPKDKATTQVKPDKQQKKQLKREADLKLKIESIQKDLQKAERKATKAHANIDALTTQLQELNAKLAHNHAPSDHQEEAQQIVPVPEETTHTEQEPSVNESTDNQQPADGDSYEDSQAIEELHQASLPPVEGRDDISDSTASSSTTETTEPTQQPDEQTPPSEQPEIAPESPTEGNIGTGQAEPEHAEEQHTPHRRSSHHHTATHETHES